MIISHNATQKKSILKLNPKATFDNLTVSGNPNITYFEAFKNQIGFNELLDTHISYNKHHNSTYSTTDVINFMVNAVVLGYTRFYHMDTLRKDEVFRDIMGGKVSSEKVCRDLLLDLPKSTANQLRRVNKHLLEIQSSIEDPREVVLNFDDSVVTVFGNQEGTGVGYNPRYKGRPSFKEKICVIANTDEVVSVSLENGRNHLINGFKRYYQLCKAMLPGKWIVKRVRVDRGGFDQKIFKLWEDENIEYVVKVKMYNSVHKIVDYVNSNQSQFPWEEIDKTFSLTEITLPLPSWDRARRIVLIRKRLTEIPKQPTLDSDWFKYEYQAIVTNIDYMTPEEIFDEYNQRCDIENNIDELKEGFAFDENSQQNKKCNELYLLIKMLAYNLNNFFKRSFMPDHVHHHEIQTLRRLFYSVPGNMVGRGKYRHLKLSPNDFLQGIIEYIRYRLKTFKLPEVAV